MLETAPVLASTEAKLPSLFGRVALSQFNPLTGDLHGNTARIIESINAAKNAGASLIALPEAAVTGYCVADTLEYDEFVQQNKRMLQLIAEHTAGITAVVGFIDYDPGKINDDGRLRKYNAAAVISDGKIAGIASKVNLPNYRYFDDKRYFTPGEHPAPISVTIGDRVVKLGVVLCEDIWDESYEHKPVKELAAQGADVIIGLNASPFAVGKFERREALIRRHIAETGLPFIYVNTVGVGDNGKNLIPFDGESLAYDRSGVLVARGKQFEEQTLLVDLDAGQAPALPRVAFRREKEMYEAAVMSVRDYARKTGFRKILVPVSGGIDSALAVAMCSEAVGPENVHAFNLPSKFNSETTKSIAAELCANLGVTYGKIPIQEIGDTIERIFTEHHHPIGQKISKENLQARIRGVLMMLESNDAGCLLVSCGNKTEIALGYSTLYGDMCGGLSVIGDFSKVDVYKASRYVNKRFGREIIPEATFTITPSAELSEGQYDPFDYAVTSPLVDEFTVNHRSPRQVLELFLAHKLDETLWELDSEGKSVYDKHNAETFRALVFQHFKLFKNSVYKRLQGAPIIALTESAFGFDRRESIINAWDGGATV